jgi:hypothetical protein
VALDEVDDLVGAFLDQVVAGPLTISARTSDQP